MFVSCSYYCCCYYTLIYYYVCNNSNTYIHIRRVQASANIIHRFNILRFIRSDSLGKVSMFFQIIFIRVQSETKKSNKINKQTNKKMKTKTTICPDFLEATGPMPVCTHVCVCVCMCDNKKKQKHK